MAFIVWMFYAFFVACKPTICPIKFYCRIPYITYNFSVFSLRCFLCVANGMCRLWHFWYVLRSHVCYVILRKTENTGTNERGAKKTIETFLFTKLPQASSICSTQYNLMMALFLYNSMRRSTAATFVILFSLLHLCLCLYSGSEYLIPNSWKLFQIGLTIETKSYQRELFDDSCLCVWVFIFFHLVALFFEKLSLFGRALCGRSFIARSNITPRQTHRETEIREQRKRKKKKQMRQKVMRETSNKY